MSSISDVFLLQLYFNSKLFCGRKENPWIFQCLLRKCFPTKVTINYDVWETEKCTRISEEILSFFVRCQNSEFLTFICRDTKAVKETAMPKEVTATVNEFT